MSEKSLFSSSSLLALALGIFLFLTGLQALIDFNSQGSQMVRGFGAMFGGEKASQFLPAVIAVIEILAGAVLILSPFGIFQPDLLKVFLLIIFLLWAVKMIYELFFAAKPFTPTVMSWLSTFALELVLLVGFWNVGPGNSSKK